MTPRIVAGAGSLRRERAVRVVRGAIAAMGARNQVFRVVHFAVMSNHVHLIVEAAGQRELARGMQGLAIRIAKGINAVARRCGALFAERYHARALRSPREVRNAIRYVLLNARHHAAEDGRRLARGWIDPASSGPWFDGWRERVRSDAPWLRELMRMPRPTAEARSWLLGVGWRRGGLLGFDEAPG